LLLDPSPLARESLHGYLTDAPDEIALCIGPEGGFAPEEAQALAGMGFRPLRLACAILRTETAALYAVAAVETILAERRSWIPKRD
jgi:RsmE family RNA methyltransferase